MTAPAIVWLRQDLRLADNPALAAAVASKRPVVLVFVLDDETPGKWRAGGEIMASGKRTASALAAPSRGGT